MNIKDYEYIVEIAECKSLTEAAGRLCITQSALTKFLQRVEAEIGTPLFRRMGKRFVLTPVGQMYVGKGAEIIRLDQEMADELKRMTSDGAGALRFGYPMGQSRFIMNRLLPEFYKRESALAVSLKEDSSSGLVRAVEDGELDLCLAYCSQEKPGLEYRVLAGTVISLAVPERSHLLKLAKEGEGSARPLLTGDEWMEEPYIRLAGFTQSGRLAQEYFEKLGRWPVNRIYVENVRSAMSAVENGLGNCILAELPHPDFKVRYLSLPGLGGGNERSCIITRKGEYQPDAMKLFIRLMEEIY